MTTIHIRQPQQYNYNKTHYTTTIIHTRQLTQYIQDILKYMYKRYILTLYSSIVPSECMRKLFACLFVLQGDSNNNYGYYDVGDGDNWWWCDGISDVSLAARRVFSLIIRSTVFSQRCMELAKISYFVFGYLMTFRRGISERHDTDPQFWRTGSADNACLLS